jgi:hypothetical protein
MKRGVVGRVITDHGCEDLQPAHTQAAQRAGMTLAFLAVSRVIDLRPITVMTAQIHPQVDGAPEGAIALAAQINDGHPA